MAEITGTQNRDLLIGPDNEDDTIEGLNGADIIAGSGGNDTIFGGEGQDVIFGDDLGNVNDPNGGDDVISGGGGGDQIFGASGDDSINGDDGDDQISGGTGDDILEGGQGQDDIDGGAGNDTLIGGTGDDELTGGEGDDVIFAGTNTDTVFGGTGSDFISIDGVGNHVIEGGEDADGNDVDVLDISEGLGTGFTRANVVEDPNDSEAGTIELFNERDEIIGRINYSEIENIVICFTPGTKIATLRGEVAVETLRPGDKVITRDNGIQELVWSGTRTLSAAELMQSPNLQPVLVRAGSLGPSIPEQDLLLSPNHRLLMSGPEAALHFADVEVFAAAKHLTDKAGIDAVQSYGVTYIHLMFARHQVILSNGAWTESFQPGDHALKGVDDDQRNEIFQLFPELETLETAQAGFGAARRVLKRHEAIILTRS